MATPVWCEFVCRTCAATSDGLFFFGGKLSVTELKRRARGWLFSQDEAFCSRSCYDRHCKDNSE